MVPMTAQKCSRCASETFQRRIDIDPLDRTPGHF